MEHQTLQIYDLWPMAVYAATVVLLTTAMLGLSYILGERHTGRTTGEPYESGLVPTGTAWIRFNVKYYLLAVIFVLFDLESVFIFAWAVAVRKAGWSGYWIMATFIGILIASLFYLWRTGVLDWAATPPRREKTN